jgi:hypothetical protein
VHLVLHLPARADARAVPSASGPQVAFVDRTTSMGPSSRRGCHRPSGIRDRIAAVEAEAVGACPPGWGTSPRIGLALPPPMRGRSRIRAFAQLPPPRGGRAPHIAKVRPPCPPAPTYSARRMGSRSSSCCSSRQSCLRGRTNSAMSAAAPMGTRMSRTHANACGQFAAARPAGKLTRPGLAGRRGIYWRTARQEPRLRSVPSGRCRTGARRRAACCRLAVRLRRPRRATPTPAEPPAGGLCPPRVDATHASASRSPACGVGAAGGGGKPPVHPA